LSIPPLWISSCLHIITTLVDPVSWLVRWGFVVVLVTKVRCKIEGGYGVCT
jgi:hypothetical protein